MAGLTGARADALATMDIFEGCAIEDLEQLAACVQPLRAAAGQVLMQQGEQAVSFLPISSGTAEIKHVGADGAVYIGETSAGTIIGEIALLRDSPRIATVTTTEPLSGWIGDNDAFTRLVHIPDIMPRLLRMVRQRLAAFVTPIPIRMRDGTHLLLRPVLPGDDVRTVHGHIQFSSETLYRRFMTARLPSPALMHYLSEVDYVDHFVWVVTDGERPGGRRAFCPRRERSHGRRDRVHRCRRLPGPGGRELSDRCAVDRRRGRRNRKIHRANAFRQPTDAHDHGPLRRGRQREDIGVITTVIDVLRRRDLLIGRDMADQIKRVARQVIEALG